jgi:hypothetical protein
VRGEATEIRSMIKTHHYPARLTPNALRLRTGESVVGTFAFCYSAADAAGEEHDGNPASAR